MEGSNRRWRGAIRGGVERSDRDTSALVSGISRDIPVSAFLEGVMPGYPHVCMLKIADSWLLNAQIARTAIWISSWKLYFSSAAAAWLGSRRAQHGALAGRRIAGAVFGTLTGRRRGRLVSGAGTILPCCWPRSGWCRLRWRSLVELISFVDAPPAGLVQTRPRCNLQAHDVVIEVAQQFGKIVVNRLR